MNTYYIIVKQESDGTLKQVSGLYERPIDAKAAIQNMGYSSFYMIMQVFT